MPTDVTVRQYVRPVNVDRSGIAGRAASWMAIDWAVVLYVTFVAAVAFTWSVPRWQYILTAHVALIVALLLVPPRGAAWEEEQESDSPWLASARRTARFLRYTYPALLLTFFFEEVSLTVNAAAPQSPFWFEHYLFAADRGLFGSVPAVTLSQAGNPVVDEIMSFFHFSYFLLIIGGIVIAWTGARTPYVGPTFRLRERYGGPPKPWRRLVRSGLRDRGTTPGRGFDTAMTCMMLGFFLSYVWYPFLPARGPWQHAEIMAGLRPFGGWVFTPLLKLLMSGVAVTGGCFPSAHVSGTWALTFGLYRTNRKSALALGAIAVGLSIACVYTRYHHAVDVFAGLAVAVVAAALGCRLTRSSQASRT